jgi:hypothetical protein
MTKEERRGYRCSPLSSQYSLWIGWLLVVIPVASLISLLVTPAVADIAGEDVVVSETFIESGFPAGPPAPDVFEPAADPAALVSSPLLFFDLGQSDNISEGAGLETEIFFITINRLGLAVNSNPAGVFDRSPSQPSAETDDISTPSVEAGLFDTDSFAPRLVVSALSSTGESVPDEPWTGPLLGCILAVIGFSFYARKRMRSQ